MVLPRKSSAIGKLRKRLADPTNFGESSEIFDREFRKSSAIVKKVVISMII